MIKYQIIKIMKNIEKYPTHEKISKIIKIIKNIEKYEKFQKI